MAKNVFFAALGDPEGNKSKAGLVLIKEEASALEETDAGQALNA